MTVTDQAIMAANRGRRPSRAIELADGIAARIEREELPVGERLGTKADLRRRHSVAAGTLNEALRLLQTRGTVDVRPGPGGGVFVASPSAEVRLNHLLLGFRAGSAAMAECLAVRDALEPLIVREAAARCTSEDLAELESILERMAIYRGDAGEYLRSNWALHRRIADVATNSVLKGIYTTLLDFISGALLEVRPDAVFGRQSGRDVAIHRAIVAAIGAGDATAAQRHLRRHPSLGLGGR